MDIKLLIDIELDGTKCAKGKTVTVTDSAGQRMIDAGNAEKCSPKSGSKSRK